MPIPTFHFSISGSAVAFYGAVLSTITAAAQIVVHYRDRANVRLRVEHNMEVIGDPRREGIAFTILYITNAGRRPVTITTVGGHRLFPLSPFVAPDTRPDCPYELTEGKQMTAWIDEADIENSAIEYWAAWDTTSREHRLNIAPWWKRIPSRLRWRIRLSREKKERILKEKLKHLS